MDICAVVLAATDHGEMCSEQTKFVHSIAGKPLITWIKDALLEVNANDQIYVVGNNQEQIRNVIGDHVAYVLQDTPRGTGDAVFQASSFLEARDGITLVIHGHTPLIQGQTLKNLLKKYISGNYQGLIMSSLTDRPHGYDRILKDNEGRIISIVKDEFCEEEYGGINEVVAGVYCFDTALLLSTIGRLGSYQNLESIDNNFENNHYLSFSDIIKHLSIEGYKLGTFQVPFEEIIKVNTRIGLEEARMQMSWRICKSHMAEGVTIMDPASTRIDAQVTIGRDSEISPGSTIKGNSKIGSNVKLSRACSIENSIIADKCHIESSNIKESFIGEAARIGPYVHIHSRCQIGRGTKIESFSDISNSTIGHNVKISPNSVINNAKIGNDVAWGAGSVIISNDADSSKKTLVEDNVIIGANSTLLAPIEIKEHAFITCGSVVIRNVPSYSLNVGSVEQMIKTEWVMSRYKSEKDISFKSAARAGESLFIYRVEQEMDNILKEALEYKDSVDTVISKDPCAFDEEF